MIISPAMEPLLFSFGGGGLCGYLAAKALRVMAKIVGLIIGAFILGISLLAGIIDVDWQSLQSQTESFAYNATSQILAAINHTTSNWAAHPSIIAAEGTPMAAGAGFLAGVTLGIKR